MPYETKEEILKLGEIDEEFANFLKAYPIPPADLSDINAFKEVSKARLPQVLQALGATPPSIIKEEVTINTSDNYSNRALVFKPATPPKDGSPLVVVYHGGGFAVGFPEAEEQTCRNVVTTYGAVCVSVGYRLAPEFKFPTAHNDCWDATKWAAANAASLGADPSRGFVIGGTSAGGNIAAVLALRARDEGLTPKLTGQWLAIPATCPRSEYPEKYKDFMYSWEQNEVVPVLPVQLADLFFSSYKSDEVNSDNFGILNHSRGHADLPPAFLQIDGLDPLRDEGLVYERVLREAGVKTRLDVYPGLPHSHWSFFPMLESSKRFRVNQVEGFGWLLGQKAVVGEDVADAKAGFG